MNISMSSQSPAAARGARSQVQMVSGLFHAVFLLVGILGFVPGITATLGSITFAGHHTDAALLGLFQVTVLHNIVHLLFGVVGMLGLRSRSLAKSYLIVGGIIYAVLWIYAVPWIYGMVIPMESMGTFVGLNTADNWLHFVLAAAMITTGFVFGRKPRG